jgi:hypothetical protein
MTPLDAYHSGIGDWSFHDNNYATGVCADNEFAVVAHCERGDGEGAVLGVFRRHDGALVRRIGRGVLGFPASLCSMPSHREIAVGNFVLMDQGRVSVFLLTGAFQRHVGEGVLLQPTAVACSAFGELCVADALAHRLFIFGPRGEVLKQFRLTRSPAAVLLLREQFMILDTADVCRIYRYV